MIPRLLFSILLGFQLGRERKRNDHHGGRRTFALISLASCLLAVISVIAVQEGYDFDFMRLMSYGIAGIGFLGAGIIYKNKNQIEGLTTAAAMWCLVPMGFLVGLGYYSLGLFVAVCVYILLDFKYWR